MISLLSNDPPFCMCDTISLHVIRDFSSEFKFQSKLEFQITNSDFWGKFRYYIAKKGKIKFANSLCTDRDILINLCVTAGFKSYGGVIKDFI